jgi:succinate dehydrogenase / fumarate reductase, cytochrome b subunit
MAFSCRKKHCSGRGGINVCARKLCLTSCPACKGSIPCQTEALQFLPMSSLVLTFTSLFSSSIGKKILVALTGLMLTGFILGHMTGNLLIFAGRDAINEYGHFLHTVGHGMGVWVARLGLLAAVLIHVVLTIQLTRGNKAAREQRYGVDHTQVASKSSRTMILSGLTILAFIIYHLLHFTARVGNDYSTYMTVLNGEQVHDVFRMVIAGFSWAPASVFYIIAMVLLCSHLSHGVASIPQTLGLGTHRTRPLFKLLGKLFALIVLVGNCSIPLAIWLFGYGR